MGKMRLTKTQRELKKRLEARGIKVLRHEYLGSGHVRFHVTDSQGGVIQHAVPNALIDVRSMRNSEHQIVRACADPRPQVRSRFAEELAPLAFGLCLVGLMYLFTHCLSRAPEATRVAAHPRTIQR